MRNPGIVLAVTAFLMTMFGHSALAQCVVTPPSSGFGTLQGGGTTFETKNGWAMTTSGTVRILIILFEVDYQSPGVDPTGANGYPGWPAHQRPVWMNNPVLTENLIEHDVPVGPASAQLTRYYQEASSNSFNVIGDYLLAPGNNGVFQISSTTGYITDAQAINAVNATMQGTFNTEYGHNSISYFDLWNLGALSTPNDRRGVEKTNPSDENPRLWDHVAFIFRNSRNSSGTEQDQTGYTNPYSEYSNSISPGTIPALLGHGFNTYSRFASYNSIPTDIIRHEFGHNLYGGNNFHYAGGGSGNSGMYWISYSGGWGNMGLHNCSIESWSAWDRLQMGWKNAGQVNQIAARNDSNTGEANGELDATVPAQAGTYVLRDFVLTGDALRIKLPFLPSDKYPQYIWVENHQGRDQNGNPFDKFKFESDQPSCVTQVVPGLYMYMQIDREKRTDNVSGSNLYGGYEEFARPLSANGSWDEQWVTDPNTDWCVGPPPGIAFQRNNAPNPLTGSSDTNWARYDTNSDGTLQGSESRLHWSEYDAGTATYANHLYTNGHSRQAFTPNPGNSKLSVGTNPSSASMMSLRGYNNVVPGDSKDLRRIYLNGVSVELMAQNPDGSIKVKVRFDDVDVKNDARWCADEIQLNPVATPSRRSAVPSAYPSSASGRPVPSSSLDRM